MKFTYLGTSSVEGFPAVFCNCKNCAAARKLGGVNVRTRTQALVNEDLLIDLPADTLHHFLQFGVEAHKVKYLFVTHSHKDHCYPQELGCHRYPCAKEMEQPVLRVFGSHGAYALLAPFASDNVVVSELKPFDVVELEEYRVTALPARHMGENEGALIYLIDDGEKKVLYAHDTGYLLDEVFDYLKDNGIVLDMVSYDCAYGDKFVADTGGHMGIENIVRVRARLVELGVVNEKTIHVLNHFSHGINPLQSRLEKLVRGQGFCVAYDGRVMEI